MKITFAGTGIMSSTQRANTSMLVDNVLFDCGAGTVKQLFRLGVYVPTAVRYVCISHYHVDHFLDLGSLYFAREKDKSQLCTIIGRKGIRRKMIQLMQFTHGDGREERFEDIEKLNNLEFIEVEPGDVVELPGMRLEVVELEHNTCRPLGYILEKEGKRVAYCCDMNPFEGFEDICQKADMMCSDCNNATDGSRAHMGQDLLRDIAQRHPDCRFYALHRGDYEPKYPDILHYPQDGDILEF